MPQKMAQTINPKRVAKKFIGNKEGLLKKLGLVKNH